MPLTVHFPQAFSDFTPSLFDRTEHWKAGNAGAMWDLKLALLALHRGAQRAGFSITTDAAQDGDTVFTWSAKHMDPRYAARAVVIEHGWIPRASYQASAHGANAGSFAARNFRLRSISADALRRTKNHLDRLRTYFQSTTSVGRVAAIRKDQSRPFVLFPLQLANDFNLRDSGSDLARFHSNRPDATLSFAQACVDKLAASPTPYPVVFKQHPADPTDLRSALRLPPGYRLITNAEQISTHELFATGLCRLVVGVNSNTMHEALVWGIPIVAWGTLIWNEAEGTRPFPKDVKEVGHLSAGIALQNPNTLFYLHYLLRHQWFIDDFTNPMMFSVLVETRGECCPGSLRDEFGLSF